MRTQAAEQAADRVTGLEELYVRNAPWALRTAYFLVDQLEERRARLRSVLWWCPMLEIR